MSEMRHILDAKKQQIEATLAGLFEDVQAAIKGAMDCLTTQDFSNCDQLIRNDAKLNNKRRLVEQDCLVAIASQQPVAHDLRDIVADMRIAAELERIGDYASDIARIVLKLNGANLESLGVKDILDMSGMCQQMLLDVARAHQAGDAVQARAAAAADDALDARLKQFINNALAAMRGDTNLVDNGSRLLWIAHNLERCGDRATNIAEQVVFRVEGEPVELD